MTTSPRRLWSVDFPGQIDEDVARDLEDFFGLSMGRLRLPDEHTVGRLVFEYNPAATIEMLLITRTDAPGYEFDFISNLDSSERSVEWNQRVIDFVARLQATEPIVDVLDPELAVVLARTLGIRIWDSEVRDYRIFPLINAGQRLPCRYTGRFETVDTQLATTLELYEQRSLSQSWLVDDNDLVLQVETEGMSEADGRLIDLDLFINVDWTFSLTIRSERTGRELTRMVGALTQGRDSERSSPTDALPNMVSSELPQRASVNIAEENESSSVGRYAPPRLRPTLNSRRTSERTAAPSEVVETPDMTSVLPVYLVVDTSASMSSRDGIALQSAVQLVLFALRADHKTASRVALGVITFGGLVNVVLELDRVDRQPPLPEFTPSGGGTDFGALFETLSVLVQRDVTRLKSAPETAVLTPIVFVFTDGDSTTPWHESFARFNALPEEPALIAFGVRDANRDLLRTVSGGRVFIADPRLKVYDLVGTFGDVVSASVIRYMDGGGAVFTVEVPADFKH